MQTRAPLLALALLASLGVVPAACGGAKKPAEDASEAMGAASAEEKTTAAPDDSSSAPAASSAATGGDSAPPLGSVFGTGSSSDQKTFEALSSAPAAKLDKNGAKANDALAKKIREQAKKFATGMKAEGAMARATLKEGDRAQMDVSLEQGKCYAIIGAAEAGVTDLDLQLMVAPGVMSAQDPTDDELPMIGKAPNPFCPDSTTQYKLGLYAEKGGGAAAAQVFSAKKK
jgi:hypothetical protein